MRDLGFRLLKVGHIRLRGLALFVLLCVAAQWVLMQEILPGPTHY